MYTNFLLRLVPFWVIMASIALMCVDTAFPQLYLVRVSNLFEPQSGTLRIEYGNWIAQDNLIPIIAASGQPIDINSGDRIRTEYPYYIGAVQGNTHKFKMWDNNRVNYWFTNQPTLTYDQTFGSYLDITHNATLRSSLEDIVIDDQWIRFLDPWYAYMPPQTGTATYQQPNDFLPRNLSTGGGNLSRIAYGGIFTGIGPDPINPSYPYYSLQAWNFLDALQHQFILTNGYDLSPGDWIFNRVKGANVISGFDTQHSLSYMATRYVKFTSDNAIATAWYKQHMFSNTTECPTYSNSQRKVDVDRNGVYHACYESSDEIWYTKSTDGGKRWWPEQLVSSGYGNSHRPSIAEFGGTVYIVYVGDDGVVLKTSTNNGPWDYTWSESTARPDGCHPVVEADSACNQPSPAVYCVGWEDRDGLGQNCIRFYISELTGWQGPIRTASGFLTSSQYGSPMYPSIATRVLNGNFDFAWKDGTRIFYRGINVFRCNPIQPLTINLSNVELVNFKDREAVGPPSITQDYLFKQVITYEGFSPYRRLSQNGVSSVSVKQRRYPSLTPWSTTSTAVITINGKRNTLRPSVGALQPNVSLCTNAKSFRGIRVTFNSSPLNTGVIQLIDPSSCKVKLETFATTGYDPNIVAVADPSGTMQSGLLKQLYCINIDTIVLLNFDHLQHQLASDQTHLHKSLITSFVNSREVISTLDTSFAYFSVSEPRTLSSGVTTQLDWNVVHDSMIIGEDVTLNEKMRTESFAAESGTELHFNRERYISSQSSFPSQAAFTVNVHDASTGNISQSVSIPVQAFPTDSSESDIFSLDLSSHAGTTVYISIGAYLLPDSSLSINSVFTESDAGSKRTGRIIREPSMMTLEQNRPNPFNPITTISFTLPFAGDVQLLVSNLIGKRVSALASGHHNAGSYTYRFDGSSYPSGVYVARLISNGVVLSRKMILLK